MSNFPVKTNHSFVKKYTMAKIFLYKTRKNINNRLLPLNLQVFEFSDEMETTFSNLCLFLVNSITSVSNCSFVVFLYTEMLMGIDDVYKQVDLVTCC